MTSETLQEEEEEKPEQEEQQDTAEDTSKNENLEKEPEEVHEEPEEQEQEEGQRSNKILVTMYGALKGDYKCPVCQSGDKYFKTNDAKRKFRYKHIDVMSEKGRKAAERHDFNEMPFFRYRMPGETKWEWISGWNSVDWDEMKP